MKSLAELADMKKSGEKVDVFSLHKGHPPNRNIKEKRRNENRRIQKCARQRLKRNMLKALEEESML
jgi:hypothetical protein